jgi:hypothetical protein
MNVEIGRHEHYNSVLEIARSHSFIARTTKIGTTHLYWILTGPSFSVCVWRSKIWEGNSELSVQNAQQEPCNENPIYVLFFWE